MSSPSLFFEIDPTGKITTLGSYEKLTGPNYRSIGCSFPQVSMPNMNFELLSSAVGKTLYKKGIFGYVTVDLVSFPDPSN